MARYYGSPKGKKPFGGRGIPPRGFPPGKGGKFGGRYGGPEEEEMGFYGQPQYGGKYADAARHENYGMFILIGAGVLLLIIVIGVLASGASGGGSSSFTNPMAAAKEDKYQVKLDKTLAKISKEDEAMKLYNKARAWELQNPYAEKYEKIAKYQELLLSKPEYQGTKAWDKAQKRIEYLRTLQR